MGLFITKVQKSTVDSIAAAHLKTHDHRTAAAAFFAIDEYELATICFLRSQQYARAYDAYTRVQVKTQVLAQLVHATQLGKAEEIETAIDLYILVANPPFWFWPVIQGLRV